MRFLQLTALLGVLAGMVALSCATAGATPFGASAHHNLLATQSEESSPLMLQVQYRPRPRYGGPGPRRYPPQRYYDHGDDAGAAIAAGIFGLILGGIIAAETQRQQTITYCARRYRSYDPQSMTYLGYDGLRYPCP